jgi:hypothetical protein
MGLFTIFPYALRCLSKNKLHSGDAKGEHGNCPGYFLRMAGYLEFAQAVVQTGDFRGLDPG